MGAVKPAFPGSGKEVLKFELLWMAERLGTRDTSWSLVGVWIRETPCTAVGVWTTEKPCTSDRAWKPGISCVAAVAWKMGGLCVIWGAWAPNEETDVGVNLIAVLPVILCASTFFL